MKKKTFSKTLSANDVGSTGAHQGGILVPKSESDLLAFLPALDSSVKNPDAWIECMDEDGNLRRFRFVYYNNRLHVPTGTRNEYRITHMTRYFRDVGAREGDTFEISRIAGKSKYSIQVVRTPVTLDSHDDDQVFRIKINSGWRRIH